MLIQAWTIQIIISLMLLWAFLYFRFFKKKLQIAISRKILLIFWLDTVFIISIFLSTLWIQIKENSIQETAILIDWSYSMSVNDFKPNRYERIKQQLIDHFSHTTRKPTIVIFASYPIPLSYLEYTQSDYRKFSSLQWRSWSAPWDVLLRTQYYYKNKDIILFTDWWINTWYDLGDTLNMLSWNITIWILDTKDQIIQLTGQKPALVQMNQWFWQQQTLWVIDLKIISDKSDIQRLLLPKKYITYKNITIELLICAWILLLTTILLRVFLAWWFGKDSAE
jgi:hypothetical protein